MRTSGFAVAGVVGLILGSPAVRAAGIYEGLNQAEKVEVDAGRIAERIVETGSESPWPKSTLILFLKATPEEAMAVFTDYDLQKSYISSLKKSQISRRINARTTEVDYILSVPVISDEAYTIRNVMSAYDAGASFRLDWSLVRATTTKASTGHTRFEAHGTGTILEYYNYVIPGRFGASTMRSRALQQVRDTAAAIRTQIEKEHLEGGELLARQLATLRAALGW